MIYWLWCVALILLAVPLSGWLYRNHKLALLVVSIMFFAPIILQLKILEFAIQRISRYLLHRFHTEGVISRHLKTLTGLQVKHSRLLDGLLESIESFTGVKMAIVIQPAGQVVEFVPESERGLPQHEQTVILMKKIPRGKIVEERDKLVALSDRGRVEALRSSSVAYQITKMQLAGWRNVLDENGQQVPCDLTKRDAMYDLLPLNVQDELEQEFGGGLRVQGENEDGEAETEAAATQPE